jgi:DNA-directed RNA polymerase specialized sigma24 family protein
VSRLHWFRKGAFNADEYASNEEFVSAFKTERATLYRLALLLTLKPETAELCLAHALQECIANSSVCREWLYSWSRRVVIRTAIGQVKNSAALPSDGSIVDTQQLVTTISTRPALNPPVMDQAIVDLSDFERLVFVICDLERYSVHDCALLLDRAPRDVYDAWSRASQEIARLSESQSELSKHTKAENVFLRETCLGESPFALDKAS